MALRKLTLFELHLDDARFNAFAPDSTNHDVTDEEYDAIESDESDEYSEHDGHDYLDTQGKGRLLVPVIGLAALALGASAVVYRRMNDGEDVRIETEDDTAHVDADEEEVYVE